MRKIVYLLLALFLASCAGTVQTARYESEANPELRKAYIVSTENSEYIKFKFGKITPFGYLTPVDDPAEKSEVIGNTDTIIKQELERHGILAAIGKRGDMPEDFDFIVQYNDTWRWDFKMILDRLEIAFVSPDGEKLLAKSTFNIYKNKELHNFPTPEKEVPKMIRELLKK
ncbi:hypothetical protein GCM10007103_04640 [Salinimicrobium marinum]|uniref:DUF4136 domain-containing protein n=1 Tax=Salinimicrobium marinum TaxID=680283 RepID=A0A918S631_9FLAO|nr:hypothetical protein [Salinimicrobium marinum]GHA26352.1 hypothetical protein GCM10007103_04640 [Salinimicrobium marinum]